MDKEEIKKEEIEDIEISAEEKKAGKKTALIIMAVVLLGFACIVLITGILGKFLGKSAEMIALVAVAVILAVLLYQSKRS